jgi:MoxR-like ATPase
MSNIDSRRVAFQKAVHRIRSAGGNETGLKDLMQKISASKNPYTIDSEPFYLDTGDEICMFEAAASARLPVMLKGPTGCGKTRFVEHMAFRLKRPLITVACHEDLFASDLIGRYLLKDDETVWVDGPLTRAVRMGAICYLDEVVEARKDTTVVIHPLTDNRRTLSIDKKGEVIQAHPDFLMVISYNPGYQSVLKDLKQSTRQRFVALAFDYPAAGRRIPHRGRRRECGRRYGGATGDPGRQNSQYQGIRPYRRGVHPTAHLCRQPDPPGYRL